MFKLSSREEGELNFTIFLFLESKKKVLS